MFLSGLDETDRQIVEALIRNARISYSDLGELVGLSCVAVKSRIDALEKRGIIEEYTTIINPQKLSGAVSCYFEIETEPSSLKTVTDILEKNEMVTQIYLVSGGAGCMFMRWRLPRKSWKASWNRRCTVFPACGI